MAPECWATLNQEKQFEEHQIAALIMPLFPHFYLSLGKCSANSRHHKPLVELRCKQRHCCSLHSQCVVLGLTLTLIRKIPWANPLSRSLHCQTLGLEGGKSRERGRAALLLFDLAHRVPHPHWDNWWEFWG